jgi:murein DD-endopeptidase MepM/ murein hydrolase activator NlpD
MQANRVQTTTMLIHPADRAHDRRAYRTAPLFVLLGVVVAALAGHMIAPVQAAVAQDTLLITPTTQGVFTLPQTGVTLEIGYASVTAPARLTVTRQESGGYSLAAVGDDGSPLARFEMPLIAHLPPGAGPYPQTAHTGGGVLLPAVPARTAQDPVVIVLGWPVDVTLGPPEPDSAPDGGRWLVVFDAHGVYAQPAWDALPDSSVWLGPLEHFAPDLIDPVPDSGLVRYAASEPAERAILRTDTRTGTRSALPTAARTDRYTDRFVPEDRRNPGGFMLLGWARADDLPDVVRALRATIPDDPDIPAPGVPQAPLRLILPFDCAQDWVVSWGYHHSTPQNRFAVDFATQGPGGTAGQPVYAAHAGRVYLKRYGTPDHLIDVGLSARVVAEDGITSTVYGHLDPAATFWRWNHDPADLPNFEWVTVGEVAQGEVIGTAGQTGYATGPHIHFALWAWDQSLYQPVPLGGLVDFVRGQPIPAALRPDCDRYRSADR